MKRLWYIAHQVGAETRDGMDRNLDSLLGYQRELVRAGIHAVAPWYAMACSMNDKIKRDRDASLEVGMVLVGRFDGVIAVGTRWSTGMSLEAEVAKDAGLPVVDFVGKTAREVGTEALAMELLVSEPDKLCRRCNALLVNVCESPEEWECPECGA
jgi:hypothetical protein